MRWVIAVASLLPGLAEAASPCTCADQPAIKHRLKEIDALINGYQNKIARIGSGQRFSESAYNAFQSGTQQPTLNALRRSTPGAPKTFGGRTDPSSCHTEFPGEPTPCLRK